MKKIYIIPLALFFLTAMTSNILAATAVTTVGGESVTITTAGTDASTDLVFNPSPNTLIGYNISATGTTFAVNSISAAAAAGGDAIEYGMASDSNQVFKTERAAEYDLVAPTATNSSGL